MYQDSAEGSCLDVVLVGGLLGGLLGVETVSIV